MKNVLSHSIVSDSVWPHGKAPLSMEFSRQEYYKWFAISSSRNLPDLGIELLSPASPALQADSLLLSHQGILVMKKNILLSSKHLKTVPGT